MDPDYCDIVTKLRIYSEDGEWFLDGRDDENRYTPSCWSFDTFQDAVDSISDFIKFIVRADSNPDRTCTCNQTGKIRLDGHTLSCAL